MLTYLEWQSLKAVVVLAVVLVVGALVLWVKIKK